ncbi:DUF4124 domain-containing protein [Marinobacter sp. M216]|uniref:DUF4124 domain-containing protein n=1 Tax=Marinobacter albus TaxID=3030833 RepID=A0ABT7HGI0_9GAMM|nr:MULTISPECIES: DUF4124 domain-containing protein [unclassified Marinobacter]MBW7473111.1 DUF4124 domain-containing protein [Marinobacter sp. F4218]MDK9559496.1 DUF4124 domain-containing protein [Marinobacter sp. M216]
MNKKILTLTLLLAVVPGISMSASVYKWTDENGVTHFGDRQPNGKQSEKVNVRSGTTAKSASKKQSPQERLSEVQKDQENDAVTRREAAENEARSKQRAANCETARSNLEIIDSNARIRVQDNGEQRYLSPEEIADQRQKFQEIADENCGPENLEAAQ